MSEETKHGRFPRFVAVLAFAVVAGLLPLAALVFAEIQALSALPDLFRNRNCNLGDYECAHSAENAPWQLAEAAVIAITGCLFVTLIVLFLRHRFLRHRWTRAMRG